MEPRQAKRKQDDGGASETEEQRLDKRNERDIARSKAKLE